MFSGIGICTTYKERMQFLGIPRLRDSKRQKYGLISLKTKCKPIRIARFTKIWPKRQQIQLLFQKNGIQIQ